MVSVVSVVDCVVVVGFVVVVVDGLSVGSGGVDDPVSVVVSVVGSGALVASTLSGSAVAHAGVSFHLCKSGVVHHRTAVWADRRSVL